MTTLQINEILRHPDRVPYPPTEYVTCMAALADLTRALPFRPHIGISEVPFDETESERAFPEFLAVFAPEPDVGFVITRHCGGSNWIGRRKFSYALHLSLPVTGQVELIGLMKDFPSAVAKGVRYLTEADRDWARFKRASRLQALCGLHGIRVENDPPQIAAALAGFVCRGAAAHLNWDLTHLATLGQERCTCLMMALFVASNHFSRLSGAEFELVTIAAPIRLFPLAQSLRVGREVAAFRDTYNALMQRPTSAQMLKEMGDIIADWTTNPDPMHVERLSARLNLLYLGGSTRNDGAGPKDFEDTPAFADRRDG